ncbi:MAG TPA: type II toxin-antitoxin system VapC family toxin [Vicinamibacterales bacterium]|jgi:PIN domain nuclease of toxin-antitoxin system|nr:type II toxin-antitoxin system VapC family toxin [Vicinamibacterales bacterium]
MTLLLDTQAFLWRVTDDRRLSKRARTAVAATPCVVSIASCWEMAIKASIGKLTVPLPVSRFMQEQLEINGFSLLPVALEAAAVVADLPFHHRDPFDRLLVAQAQQHGVAIVSADPVFTKYRVRRIW